MQDEVNQAGSTCGLNRDKIVWVFRLAGCKNFVGE